MTEPSPPGSVPEAPQEAPPSPPGGTAEKELRHRVVTKDWMDEKKNKVAHRDTDRFAGKGATQKMKKWQLPGDAKVLKDYQVKINVTPCFFVPVIFLMVTRDGLGWHQETPTMWTNGSLYNGTEAGIRGFEGAGRPGGAKDSLDRRPGAIEADFRTTRAYFLRNDAPSNLTCKYGEPEAYFGVKHGYFCPLVFLHTGPVVTPLIWFFPLAILGVFGCCSGLRKIRTAYFSLPQQLPKAMAPRKDEIRPWPKACALPLGLFLGFYENGFADAHVHLWVLGMTLLCVHSILARIFTQKNGNCLRWGNWAGHWDECLPLAAADIAHTHFMVGSVLLAWTGGLWTVPAFDSVKMEPERLGQMDPVTKAAVLIKNLVRKQMAASKQEAYKATATLGKVMKDVCAMVGAASGDAGLEKDDAEDALGVNDFIEDFSEQLEGLVGSLNIDYEVSEDTKEKAKEEGVQVFGQGMESIQKPNGYFSASVPALAGGLLGLSFLGIFMLAPQGSTAPFEKGDGFGERFCENDGVWCNGQSLGSLDLVGSVYYVSSFRNMANGIKAQTVVLLVLRAAVHIIFGALFGIMLAQTLKPFEDAARPLDVLGNILNKWVVDRKVTVNQLNAWVLARRSFLHNECQLMLHENAGVVIFYIIVMMICLTMQLWRVFMKAKGFNVALCAGTVLFAFAAITCVQAAIGCHTKQKSHQSLLRSLKEALMCSAKGDETNPHVYGGVDVRVIDAIIDNLERQDYQTKLLFMPLNPTLLKGVVGYLVTGTVAIAGKLGFEG